MRADAGDGDDGDVAQKKERKRERERDDWLYESLLRVFIPMLVIHCECVVTLRKIMLLPASLPSPLHPLWASMTL